MARIAYLTPADLSDDKQDLLARDISLNRALAHSASGSRAFWTLGYWIRRDMKLDQRLREMVILQIGCLARNAYEFSHHVKIALESGVSEDDIDQLLALNRNQPTTLCTLDQLVLEATREHYTGPGISAATMETLANHFDTEQLVELTLTMSFYLGAVRLLSSLAIDIEPEYLHYLERFTLTD